MQTIKYLSPSSMSKWAESPEAFYLDYLADQRRPRFPQRQYMAVGSAFDAYVKSHLHARTFGPGVDPRFDLETILAAQVDFQHLDWGRVHGAHVFDQYRRCGALAAIEALLDDAEDAPRFESDIIGPVRHDGAEVVFRGKPDVSFTRRGGRPVILDWKVNGYMSRHPPSPRPGYLSLRAEGAESLRHKDVDPVIVDGITINRRRPIERVDEEWARQLACYGWLLGEPVGTEFVVGIDQLVCDARKEGLPTIRVAEHRCICTPSYQVATFAEAREIWDVVHSDHIFRHLTREESIARCAILDGRCTPPEGDDDALFALMCPA